MEAEYIALAHSMQELLPIMWLVEELADALPLDQLQETLVSTVLKDNNGALILANNSLPQMTPRSKYIGVKYHWFSSWINKP
eukprot:11296925-Ditylum_brightwellii.AAC.1